MSLSENAAIIGRDDINDLEAILSVSNTDIHATISTVKDNADAIFTWDYEKGQRPALNRLYEKAKTSQWNGETDLDWSIDVDPEAIAVFANGAEPNWEAIEFDPKFAAAHTNLGDEFIGTDAGTGS